MAIIVEEMGPPQAHHLVDCPTCGASHDGRSQVEGLLVEHTIGDRHESVAIARYNLCGHIVRTFSAAW